MKTNTNIIWIIIILLGIGGIVYASMDSSDNMMKDNAMVKEDAMMKDNAMMQKEDSMVKDEAMMQKDAMMKGDTMMKKDEAMMIKSGTYVSYSPEKVSSPATDKTVLFFNASWCPTCKSLDANIQANLSAIPKDVTILNVDYDAAAELKKKYGVTYQHTFVQVDSQGTMLAKWSGSPTLTALVSEIK